MDALKVLNPGLGASIQDFGRRGWKRFGVPPSGVMDRHAAAWANRLVGNVDEAPVLELLLPGAVLEAMADVRLAVAGAEAGAVIASWHARAARRGETLRFSQNVDGLWTYVAIAGGFDAPRIFGSASAYPRGGIGETIGTESILRSANPVAPSNVGGSWIAGADRRSYASPPLIRVWRGPQWDWFDEMERAGFFGAEWEVSSRSDRVGYRLEGARMNPPRREMRSEPVLVGSIQVPPNGQLIVTMRDGPTVGGYPKIALVDGEALSWLAQCRPGVKFRFAPME